MDNETARKIFVACQSVSEILTGLLFEREQNIPATDYKELENAVYQTMAYMSDYLIQPAADAYPELNPYAKIK